MKSLLWVCFGMLVGTLLCVPLGLITLKVALGDASSMIVGAVILYMCSGTESTK